ncbi:phage protein d : Putative uncharacterized protein OS=Moorea producens 3L GN=LYNGBM3L_06070 PE=4 SV=1: Phage_GPD [Gemmata massiliana]|uniref:FHA domain-containing protein n=1 Tax=Gemmata massiliana TaxID=1210884 RepID=A0A6P2D0E6_9BACT|nr:hypothetical protein [Gemmata massiliana]VTR92930.1 phage protein d : Putative uncharacterized protein OS=Moorea producens 3L GN=LYNGBM3L_06070 PE=4 SV=1: Phage_GPD [Gemmata massiliana]
MLYPRYRWTVGTTQLDSGSDPVPGAGLSFSLAADLFVAVDSVVASFGAAKSNPASLGDVVRLELGYKDSGPFELVFTGRVTSIDASLTTTTVTAHGATDLLARLHLSLNYDSRTAGAIVSDLAGQAGVPVATAKDGIDLPTFAVRRHRSAYEHVRALADLCGFDLYADPTGALVFAPFQGGRATHVMQYGAQILAFELEERRPRAGRVEVWGESPGQADNQLAWAWLSRDFRPLLGKAGDDDPLRLLERPVVRTGAAAQAAADAALARLKRQTRQGQVRTLGRPEVRLGDAIELRGLPQSDANGKYQVRAVRHNLDKRRGFTTTVRFQGG